MGYEKLSPGRRMRLGSRPVVIALARLIATRSGTTAIRHVRSHTGDTSYRSQGNARADQLATMLVNMVEMLHYSPCLKAKSKLRFGVKKGTSLVIFGQRFVGYLRSVIWRNGRL